MNYRLGISLLAILSSVNFGTTASEPSIAREIETVLNQQPTLIADATVESSITKIYPHQKGGRSAATLHVQGLPVLTFLGEKVDNEQLDTSPVERAQKVAFLLNEMHAEELDATKITYKRQSANKIYSIHLDDAELVRVDGSTILPDTTNNISEDARQATNRLRRLMGNAPPLKPIAIAPKPAPQTYLNVRQVLRGQASWYGPGFHGRRTANGERFNQNAMTAAHKSLPFGTQVRVTNLRNGRSVTVRINDRGPYAHGRIIDLSAGAARVIGLHASGVAPVQVDVLGR